MCWLPVESQGWKGPSGSPRVIPHPVGALRHLSQMMPCASFAKILSLWGHKLEPKQPPAPL